MNTDRRTFIKGIGGALTLPFLESTAFANPAKAPPTRLLVVGNPFGMHPDYFFPKTYGKEFDLPPTLKSLDWLQDRMSILSHTDHGMVSGHGREISFLSGVLPENAQTYPEKNMSIDQLIARQIGTDVRFPSISAGLGSGIRMSWTANGVENTPITDPQNLFDHLFLNLTPDEKAARRRLIERNG
ncbi:MAG: DUF1552 domain-containing protein, partial [Verrucomicrobiota bacterium]